MSDFNPEAIYQKLNETGDAWVDKNAAAELLEETKKTVLAEFICGYDSGPLAIREKRALSEPAYKLHIANMVAARKEANRARVKYDSMKVLAEMRRTQESTRRAEANIR